MRGTRRDSPECSGLHSVEDMSSTAAIGARPAVPRKLGCPGAGDVGFLGQVDCVGLTACSQPTAPLRSSPTPPLSPSPQRRRRRLRLHLGWAQWLNRQEQR